MTTPSRIERNLPGILGELSAAPTPDYLDDVFARTGRTRQRPGWTFPERWLPVADITRTRAFAPAPPWRLIALALVALALVLAALIFVGSQHKVPAPFGPARNGVIPYEQGGDIYIGDPVTGQSRLLLSGPADDNSPSFSPNGQQIGFFRSHSNGAVDIYTMDLDGGNLRKITTSALADVSWAVYTPDSKNIAVIRPIDGKRRLELFDVTGQRTPQRLLADDIEPTTLAFRPPAGQEILFRGIEHGRASLFVMNADGTNAHPILIGNSDATNEIDLGGATYSADGDRIFYQAAIRSSTDNGCCQLWVADADGSHPHRFTSDVPAADVWEGVPALSPDGQWIAFWRVGQAGHVTVARSDGTGPVIQTGPTLSGTAGWVWSPDSRKILMVPNDPADSPRQYLLDPAGGPATAAPWMSTSEPDWQRLALD